MSNKSDTPSELLPTDPFDQALDRLIGHQDGAHTSPAVVQAIDFYGKTTSFMVQTVKWGDGQNTVFISQINAGGSARYILPPEVMRVIMRQQDAVTTKVRRRHGKRLAEQRKVDGWVPSFTPEMRAKALATRKRKAKARAARKQKGGN